jgi:23S rRNA G2445 N2-methylase RlmL
MLHSRHAKGADPGRPRLVSSTKLYATAVRGTGDLVARELEALGLRGARWDAGGCHFTTEDPLGAGMRACLGLRTALRVLWPLATFAATDADMLYEGAVAVAWEEVLGKSSSFAVHARTSAPPPLAYSPFLAQRVKDAIVDRMRDRVAVRPRVDRADPDVLAYVHVTEGGKAMVGLDFAGASLHERGYRTQAGIAPLRETLAAALVLASGWKAERPLLDPMCGAGTIVLEAALYALGIVPGLLRGSFGFQRWPMFGDAEKAAFAALKEEARGRVRPGIPVPIVGRDRDAEVVATARANLARCPGAVARAVTLELGDVRQIAPSIPPATIISNPPYGERIGGEGAPVFLRTLGQRLRTLDGHTAFLLAPAEGHAALGMRPSWQRKLMNGPIPVVLARYELGRASRVVRRR